MTGDEIGREVQRVRDRQVAEAVQAERQRIGEQLCALSADPWALRRWVARHGLVDAGRGATLHAVAGDVLGVCSACGGLDEFVGGASVDAELAQECPARPAESHVEPLTASPDPSGQPQPRRGLLRPSPVVPLLPATMPREAHDPDHPEHDDFVRTAGRCFATDCLRHDPNGEPR